MKLLLRWFPLPNIFQELIFALFKEVRFKNPPMSVCIGIIVRLDCVFLKSEIPHRLNVDNEDHLCQGCSGRLSDFLLHPEKYSLKCFDTTIINDITEHFPSLYARRLQRLDVIFGATEVLVNNWIPNESLDRRLRFRCGCFGLSKQHGEREQANQRDGDGSPCRGNHKTNRSTQADPHTHPPSPVKPPAKILNAPFRHYRQAGRPVPATRRATPPWGPRQWRGAPESPWRRIPLPPGSPPPIRRGRGRGRSVRLADWPSGASRRLSRSSRRRCPLRRAPYLAALSGRGCARIAPPTPRARRYRACSA